VDVVSRYYRSTRAAFPSERFPACFGPYRRESGFIRQAIGTVCVLGLFAIIGALIGASF
jgi:hypothetical protein